MNTKQTIRACDSRFLTHAVVGTLVLLGIFGQHATSSASTVSSVILSSAMIGQTSLLDLGDEEEEPALTDKTKAAPLPAANVEEEEESPAGVALPPPLVRGGVDQLGDVPGVEASKVTVETEEVCDLIQQSLNGRVLNHKVKLLRNKLSLPPTFGRKIEVMRIGAGDKVHPRTFASEEITRAWYYEERMLKRVADELEQEVSEVTRAQGLMDLSHPVIMKRAQRAITLLTIALAEHESAKERLIRDGNEWDDLRFPLANVLFRLQLSRIKLLVDQGQNQKAMAACDVILKQGDLGPGPANLILGFFEQMLLHPALSSLERNDFEAAADALETFSARFPGQPNALASQVRARLISEAETLVAHAQSERNPKLLEEAARVWPQLRGLESMRSKIIEDYPILRCAYASLPRSYSPLSARTPVERHAAALMFESLVRWREESRAGAHYVSQLATTRPLPLARGRAFRLPRAQWSDSQPDDPNLCTTEDVLWTVRLMKQVHPFGFSSAWGGLLEDVASSSGNAPDPFRVSIFLQTDHWQPLSLMDFPILPKTSFPTCGGNIEELDAFAKHPVGTGPFLLEDPGGDGEPARFVANPFYRKSDRPYVREIQFLETDSFQALEGFRKGDIHLIYDVRPAHVAELKKQRMNIVKLPARGIYFLAPNHRHLKLKNPDLRLAIAHAIDRKNILDNVFRPGDATTDHAPLNGPFPRKSWACNKQVPDFSLASAEIHLAKARQALGSIPKLRLLYPVRDQADTETKKACRLIQQQLAAVGIDIELVDLPPNDFVSRVVEKHEFDLAYWRHDFKDETYWLWPLLNPADGNMGGANFMGYVPDAQLTDLFARVLSHKMFRTIQTNTHEIHRALSREAVMVPLWELDTYVAVGDTVQDAQFSAMTFFENIDSWKIRAE